MRFSELYEETGIQASNLNLDNTFRFTTNYHTKSPRFENKIVNKTVVIFLGWLKQDVNIQVSEHDSFIWMEWKPPHAIQKKTINPLLAELDKYFKEDESRIFRGDIRNLSQMFCRQNLRKLPTNLTPCPSPARRGVI